MNIVACPVLSHPVARPPARSHACTKAHARAASLARAGAVMGALLSFSICAYATSLLSLAQCTFPLQTCDTFIHLVPI